MSKLFMYGTSLEGIERLMVMAPKTSQEENCRIDDRSSRFLAILFLSSLY